jgi:hypothetical protein
MYEAVPMRPVWWMCAFFCFWWFFSSFCNFCIPFKEIQAELL